MNKRNILFFIASTLIFSCAVQAETVTASDVQQNQYAIQHPTTYKYIGEVPKNNKKANAKNNLNKKLNLTEDQKAQIKQIKQNYSQKAAPVREQILTKRKELDSIKIKQNLTQEDKDKCSALQKEISELKAQMKELNQDKAEKVQSILTDEQKQTLKKYNKNRKKAIKRKLNFDKKKAQQRTKFKK